MLPHNSIDALRKKYADTIDPHEIDLFLMRATRKTREFLWAHPEYTLSPGEQSLFTRCIRRRVKLEPVAYILGHKEFFDLDFEVNKHTLVPRPETELMVDEILQHEFARTDTHKKKVLVVDVGTGSGNIIIALTKNISKLTSANDDYTFYGLDISKPALTTARKNAKHHGLEKKIRFIHSDLLEKLANNIRTKQYDRIIIAANLPYLSKEIYESSMPDVKDFEPKSALYSPKQGLQHYQRLFDQIQKILLAHPHLSFSVFLEISPEQKKLLPAVLKKYFSTAKTTFVKDLTRRWRLAHIDI